MFVKTISDKDINYLLDAEKPVILKLGATWCGPCKVIKPILESLAEDRKDSLLFFDMDIDDSPKTSQSLQIMGVPTIILFQNGKEISRKSGIMSKTIMEEWIDSKIKK